jgi:rubrerythrin
VAEINVSLLEHCPECGVRWWDEELPEDLKIEGGRTHYSNIIGQVWYDRIQEWECPACAHRWARGHMVPVDG